MLALLTEIGLGLILNACGLNWVVARLKVNLFSRIALLKKVSIFFSTFGCSYYKPLSL